MARVNLKKVRFPSIDYHDYVFKNGKLIGDFEGMYRHSSGVPWHQNKQANWVDVRLTKEFLKDLKPFDEIHDYGCGLGFYLAIINKINGGVKTKCRGYDVSLSACRQAKRLFPKFSFQTFNLMTPRKKSRSIYGKKRLLVLRGTLWYVFPRLGTVINNLRNRMLSTDRLLVIQNFPPLNQNFIGKNVLPNPQAIVRHFGKKFACIRSLWYQDYCKVSNDNWFLGLFSPIQKP